MEKPNGKISKQPFMVDPDVLAVMNALAVEGREARFVGGCVRDAMVNRPVHDIDIATPLRPEEVIERLTAAGLGHVPTGLAHGTVTAISDGRPFEITTLRVDVNSYGRHADVDFTDDWSRDAARRDFTINAMSCNTEGDVYDYYGGREDLRAGRVLFVGAPDQRIREDVLRILRFFRFHAHFGRGVPDAQALAACHAHAPKLARLSSERIRQEILKLLEAPDPAPAWREMIAQGITTHFLPEATNVAALERLQHLERRFASELVPLRRLAVLLDATRDSLAQITRTLRLSNAQAGLLLALADNTPRVAPDMDDRALHRAIYLHGGDLVRHCLLLQAARSGNEGRLEELYAETLSYRPPRFMLTGQDVLALGHVSGPAVGEILSQMEDWWIEQDFRPGRSELLARLAMASPPKNP